MVAAVAYYSYGTMRTMSEFASMLLLGLVQGLTEFIPVSSSGHLIIAREFFGLATTNGLAIDAVLQLATVLALIVYFWRDLLRLMGTLLSWVRRLPTPLEDQRLLVGIVLGTVPAVIIGLLLEDAMETVFRSVELVAGTLVLGSLIMVAGEAVSRRVVARPLDSITWFQSLVIGFFQSLALVPGMSRSGMTIAGGLILGLSRADAARFGFLLAIPILLGSGLKKFVELESGGVLASVGSPLLVGTLAAFFSGLLAIHVLMLFVRSQPLTVFAVYRVLLAASLLYFL